MRNLEHTLACLWLLLTPGAARLTHDACPPPQGQLTLNWTAATHGQAYRLHGTYTIRGMSNDWSRTLESPTDSATSTLDLAPGLYGIEVDPGACVEAWPALEASTLDPSVPTRAECIPTSSVTTLAIVEPGERRVVALATRAPKPGSADRSAACR